MRRLWLALICRVFGHVAFAIDTRYAIYFHCERCARLVKGEMWWRR